MLVTFHKSKNFYNFVFSNKLRKMANAEDTYSKLENYRICSY